MCDGCNPGYTAGGKRRTSLPERWHLDAQRLRVRACWHDLRMAVPSGQSRQGGNVCQVDSAALNRYKPTQPEIDALKARGWSMDSDGYWFPPGLGWGRTYREAVKEADAADRQRERDERAKAKR